MWNSTNWTESLGWMLIHSLWLMTAIAGLSVIVLSCLRSQSANLRYLIGCVSLSLSVATLPGTLVWMLLRSTEPDDSWLVMDRHIEMVRDGNRAVLGDPGQAVGVDAGPGLSESVIPLEITTLRSSDGETIVDVDSPRAEHVSVAPSVLNETKEAASGTPAVVGLILRQRVEEALRPHLSKIVLGWLCGVLLLSLRPLLGWRETRRLRRTGLSAVPESVARLVEELARRLGVKRAVAVFQSSLVRIPSVLGAWKPIILLPASTLLGMSTPQLEAVLAHELAHVRRHDFIVNVLQTLVETLLFYHPAVWWLSRRVHHERELCCDDLALTVIGDRATYGRALLALEELTQRSPAPVLAANGGHLVQRIRRLLPKDATVKSRASDRSWLAGLVLLTLVALSSVALVALSEELRPDGNNVSRNDEEPSELTDDEDKTPEAPSDEVTGNATRRTSLEEGRGAGQAALARGEYSAMEAAYQSLAINEVATHEDAMWLGHALQLQRHWKEAAESYQLMLNLADQRITALEKQTGPTTEQQPKDGHEHFGGPVRNWRLERDRELEQLRELWPQLVLLAGQIQLSEANDAEAAVRTLSRGLRFVPEAESLDKLLEDARLGVEKEAKRPHPNWFKWMYPMATQRSLAMAYEKVGDSEAAARCWCRFHLSHLAYEVGMTTVKADQLEAAISKVPADKREPFHEFVVTHCGKRSTPSGEFDFSRRLKADPGNPFEVRSRLDGFWMQNHGPSHACLAKLPDGHWLMAFTSGDAYQARVQLSRSADGKTWEQPWDFAHNNIFPTRNPSLIADDDGTLWMLCSSQRCDVNRYSSGGYQLWLCSSKDGRDWSQMKPILSDGRPFGGQYQHTAQLTRDREGRFWIFSGAHFGSTTSLAEAPELKKLELPGLEPQQYVASCSATFDAQNRCHLVLATQEEILLTSTTDMRKWEPLVVLQQREKNSAIGHPQLVLEGNRFALLYEPGWGKFRCGRLPETAVIRRESGMKGSDADDSPQPAAIQQVGLSRVIDINLPLSGSVLTRDGDDILLVANQGVEYAPPVVLFTTAEKLLAAAAIDELKPAQPEPSVKPGDDKSKEASDSSATGDKSTEKSDAAEVKRTVRVLDEQQKPIEGASVRFQFQDDTAKNFTIVGFDVVTTDVKGEVQVQVPPQASRVHLTVKADGFGEFSEEQGATGSSVVSMKQGRTIRVRAMDAGGGILRQAVPLLADSRIWGREFQPRKDGTFQSPSLALNRRWMRVVAAQEKEPMLFSDLIDIAKEKPGEDGVLQITLKPGTRLEGKLDESVPRPIAAGFVELCIVEGENHAMGKDAWIWQDFAPVQPDGSFVFESVPGGGHAQVHVLVEGYLSKNPTQETLIDYLRRHQATTDEFLTEAREYLEGRAMWPQLVPLDQPVVTMTVTCERAAACDFRLLDPSGKPVKDATVHFNPNGIFLYGGLFIPGTEMSTALMVDSLRRDVPTFLGSGDTSSHGVEAGKRREWVQKSFLAARSDAEGRVRVRNLPVGCRESFEVHSKEYVLPVSPLLNDEDLAKRNINDDSDRYGLVELVSGETIEKTIYLERIQATLDREVLVIDQNGKPLSGVSVVIAEMRVGSKDWQTWSTQRFGSLPRSATDKNGRVLLRLPSSVEGIPVEALRLGINYESDEPRIFVWRSVVETPFNTDDGVIAIIPSDKEGYPARVEYGRLEDVLKKSTAAEWLDVMIKGPNLAVLRKLLALSPLKHPEPVVLLDDGRRRQEETGSRVRIVTTGDGRFAIVQARVHPLNGDRANENDLTRLPECAFVFDMQGQLLATLGGRIGTTRSGDPEDIDVLSFGPEEDWFVRVTKFENNGPFEYQSDYYRLANPVTQSLRYFHYANSNGWSHGPETITRWGTLYFDFPGRQDKFDSPGHSDDGGAALTADGVSVNRTIKWDGDRNRFVGAAAQFGKGKPLYQVDIEWSREFDTLAPKANQLVVTGGARNYEHWHSWQTVVPEKFEAVVTLSIPRKDGAAQVVEKRLGPGKQHVQLQTKPDSKTATAHLKLWLGSDNKQEFDLPQELGDRPAQHPPIVTVLNPGESARVLERPLKTSAERLTLDIKLVAREADASQN